MVAAAHAFDAYGTLFDVHSAVMRNAEAIGPDAARLSDIWRTKQLEYTWVLNGIGHYEDFWTLTERALDVAGQMIGGLEPTLRARLLDAYASLDSYPDVAGALSRLRAEGAKVIVFSNATPAMLEKALAASGLAAMVDTLVSIDRVRVYKPDPRAYAMLDPWRGEGKTLTFYSSNRWDVAGAGARGIATVWIDRRGAPDEYPAFQPIRTAPDLLAAVADGGKPTPPA